MKKQRRGLNRYMIQDGKKRKKVSIHMRDTLKTNCEEKNSTKKKTTKNGDNGIRTHIHKNRWLLIYIYSKNERSTNCTIESFENYM